MSKKPAGEFSPTPDCCLCGRAFTTWYELAYHLVHEHLGVVVAGGKRFGWARDRRAVRCWCGGYFQHRNVAPLWRESDNAASAFAAHLERKGGLAAHILEITMKPEALP